MARRSGEPAPRGPRRRRALVVVLAGCALLLSHIAAATANTDNAKPKSSASKPSASAPATSTTTPEAVTGASGEAGEAPASTSAPSSTSKGATSKDATKGSTTSKGATITKQATKGATTSTDATSKDATKAANTSTGATSKGTTKGAAKSNGATTAKGATTSKGHAKQQGSTAPADKGPAVTKPAATTTQPDASGKIHEREKRAREAEKREREREEERERRERKRVKSHKPPPTGNEGEGSAPPEQATPPGVSTGSATASAAGASTLAAAGEGVASAATDGTPPQASDPARPILVGSSGQAVRRAAHARKRAGRAFATGALAAPGALAPVEPVAGGSAHGGHHAPPTSPGTHGSRTAGRPTPLVTTITRIVDVVPTPVRLLIGALLALALALAVRSRLAARRARRLERQRGQLLEDVGLLQAALLPVPPARLGPVGTSAAYRPAEGPGAGGDFYDVFALENGQLAVIVGDISGHGRQALPHTALVRFTLRAYLEAGLSPRAAVQTAGAVLEHQLGESFATVIAATYEPRERILTYACAGHPAPVTLGSQPGSSPLQPLTAASAPPIGVGMRTGTRQTVVSLPGRSQACFYTDGVTEARVGAELFGPARLARALAKLGPAATATELLDSVAEEADRRPDDMAACLLSVEGDAAAPKVLVEELELGRDETAVERAEQFLAGCGVSPGEIAEVMTSTLRAVGRGGAAVLEVHLADGAPEVVLQRDNVTHLGPRLDRSHAGRLSR
jgi:serine phosphatase RsbU (regulator of sigma subunit)